jgi:hypothetical protein
MLGDGRESSVFYVIATLSMALRWQRARGHVTQLQLMLSSSSALITGAGARQTRAPLPAQGGHRQAGPVAGAVFATEVIPLLAADERERWNAVDSRRA